MKFSLLFRRATFLFALISVHSAMAAGPLATLNDQPITEEEVQAKASGRMMKILSQMYDVKKEVIDEIIDDRLLEQEAKSKGLSVDNLIKSVTDKVAAPGDEEAKTIYEMQKTRAFKDQTFEEVRDRIKSQLASQKKRMAVNDLINELRGKAKIKVNIERPSVAVSVDNDPIQGPANAPVTIVEFSEFQCPFCKKSRPTIKKILETYKDKIRYTFRDFPLSFHPEAQPAAIAANCAHEQKKYWEFNEKLFDNQGSLSSDLYKKIAGEISLNLDQFNACVAKADTAEIEKDQQDGMDVGVTGTPAYFVNGKFLSGAQPFAAFQELIEEELAKVK